MVPGSMPTAFEFVLGGKTLHQLAGALVRQAEVAELVAAGHDLQTAVLLGGAVDGEAGGDGRLGDVVERALLAEAQILVEAVAGEIGAGRLPVQLLGDLLDVLADQAFEQQQVAPVAAETLEIGVDPRRTSRPEARNACRNQLPAGIWKFKLPCR